MGAARVTPRPDDRRPAHAGTPPLAGRARARHRQEAARSAGREAGIVARASNDVEAGACALRPSARRHFEIACPDDRRAHTF
ncbi:hypothetical protein C7S17_6175 [Burkholderia thailandensis]|nr:hypothetical protein [Burkholderia thailandensis]